MPPLICYLLILFIVLYFIDMIIDLYVSRQIKVFSLQLTILLAFAAILYLTTGFPFPKKTFGGLGPLLSIGIMFVFVLLGMTSHYFYYLKGKFSIRRFVKPFLISPLVLLPLIGSVQERSSVETIQMISFAVLAFQNGFFWNKVINSKNNE